MAEKIKVDWKVADKKVNEKLAKALEEKNSLTYDDFEKLVNETFKELYGYKLYDGDGDEDDFPLDYRGTLEEYFEEGYTDGEIDDYDDEDGWRLRKTYIDIDDNFAICFEVPMRVWDCEFFDEEDVDKVKIYKVKKIPVQTYRYERV